MIFNYVNEKREDRRTGERQTYDRAKHPSLGEGTAVYDNGRAVFIADDGTIEEFASIGLGGFGVNGSYLRAKRNDGTKIELDTTKRQDGDRHWRAMSYDGVHGWLVSVASELDEPRTGFMRHRWEPDGGAHVKLYVVVMEVGTPGACKRSERRKGGKLLPNEEHWFTWTLTDKKTFVWCHERDADKVVMPKKSGQTEIVT